jgi:drug/metabolite transporter (DMT)-like permease
MWFPFALLSAVFYSMLWVLARMSKGLPSSVVTWIQFVYGPILLLVASRYVDFPWSETWWWIYLTIPFLFLPAYAWAMTYALHKTEVTLLQPLFGLSSIATLLVASMFFGEVIPVYGIVGILIITFGLLSLYHGRWEVWKSIGPWITLGGAFLFGANAAIIGGVLQKFPHVFALSGIAITGHFIFCSIPAVPKLKQVVWSKRTIWIFIGLGVAMIGQDLATLYALTLGPFSYVISVKRASMLLTAVVGYIFLHERDQSLWRLLISSVLVVIGVMMLTV